MRLTTVGKDYVVINESNLEEEAKKYSKKVHLIELEYTEPTEKLLKQVVELFPETRRFVISNFIRFYNLQFKKFRDKKFYVKNLMGDNIIVFLKKNNKVLLDFTVLKPIEKELILDDLRLILEYVEVIKISESDFQNHEKTLKFWKGNIIIE